MMTIDDLIADGWTHDPSEGLIAHLGGLWRREVGGRHQLGLWPEPMHANRNGVVHGGMLMTFVDRAFGMTARLVAGAPRGATISLSHQFVAPLQIGSFASVEPKIVKLTTRMAFVEGTVFAGDEPIVQAQGVWRLAASRE
ncbi:PaaI family thioesterase [Frigidibacter albus]|uniref:PaaI family thioesterase n=2 Tax=Frigidibacter albus TaxID=1465486 RepID=A0A6L8VCX1_9RHOB|nr:PaaI family thioesterase [Frigidibacter albus]MZQ87516.1 PaaI family thioesterase [Frigidibacter albus]NBE29422.1 PaaI family thioesterase [Frigidibacter albus]GGH45023.1 thioesterase [Frigidibacter albus]